MSVYIYLYACKHACKHQGWGRSRGHDSLGHNKTRQCLNPKQGSFTSLICLHSSQSSLANTAGCQEWNMVLDPNRSQTQPRAPPFVYTEIKIKALGQSLATASLTGLWMGCRCADCCSYSDKDTQWKIWWEEMLCARAAHSMREQHVPVIQVQTNLVHDRHHFYKNFHNDLCYS